jgi:hypothetical protein
VAIEEPAESKIIARVLVVPWSTAITYLSILALPSFIDCTALIKKNSAIQQSGKSHRAQSVTPQLAADSELGSQETANFQPQIVGEGSIEVGLSESSHNK